MAQPPPPDALRAFVASTFGKPGHDLQPWVPTDFHPSPALLGRLPDGAVRDWAASLNGLWRDLGRQVSAQTLAHPERTTLLPAARGFVVPGGRFRESYYWDSYWVVLGLVACGMQQTAMSLTSNLLDAARQHGFVPSARSPVSRCDPGSGP